MVLAPSSAGWAGSSLTLTTGTVVAVDPTSIVPVHASLLLPDGVTIHPTSVAPVAGSNDTTLQLTFSVQSQPGAYDLSIGPWFVAAATGQPMAAPYNLELSIDDDAS